MKKLLIIFILLSCFFQANSFDIATLGITNKSVVDKVGVLNQDEIQNIESKIKELRTKYTTEILLVIIKTTDGEEISSIGTEIGQKIGVGKADKDNGVVILIAIDDRAWNISTGYGVEGALPDLLANKIGEKNFVLFKESRYYDGIYGAITDIGKAFEGDPSIISLQDDNKETPVPWIFEIIIILIFSSFILKPLVEKKKYNRFWIIFIIAFLVSIPFTYILINDYILTLLVNLVIWLIFGLLGIFGKSGSGGSSGWGGKSSGGGGGGFGGGSFGGGGSSGKW